MSDFPGLARNAEMQKHPLGTFSALRRPSPVATQYKRQSEMYGQALRTLTRAARRGDAGAAIEAIKYRDQANADGYSPGGISRSEDTQGNIASREQRMVQEDAIAQKENQFNMGELDRRLGGQGATTAPMSRPEMSGPPSYLKPSRTSAALDMLEGAMDYKDNGQLEQGRRTATDLGVQNPDSILFKGGNLKYRQTLDTALGQAKTPEEIAALKARGTKFGISPQAFDRRANWWDSNRS